MSKRKVELRRKPKAKVRKPSRARVSPATHTPSRIAKASPAKTDGEVASASERTEQAILEGSVQSADRAEALVIPTLEANEPSLGQPDAEAVTADPHSDASLTGLPNIVDDEPEPEGEPVEDKRAVDTILSLEIDVPGADGDLEVGRIESQEVISPPPAEAVEAPEVAPIRVQVVDRSTAAEPRAENDATIARPQALHARVQAQKTAWQRFAEAFDDSRTPGEPTETPRQDGPNDGAGEAAPERSSKPRVLAVDDDAITRKLLKMGLACHGYDCETAENGSVAQEIVQTYHPDVIVLDLLMPVMDGLSFLYWLRQTARATTPVVVLTNLDGTEIMREAVEIGANSVLRKPVHLKELLQVMHQFVPV